MRPLPERLQAGKNGRSRAGVPAPASGNRVEGLAHPSLLPMFG